MKMAILGAGKIAGAMATTISQMEGIENYAIGSRDLTKAKSFAREYNIQKAYGSYEEMLADKAIDLVYVAVPHSHHYQWTIAALNAGKNVLCEKAFAANEKQAREMTELAQQKGLLLAEAIWTRYMPSCKMLKDIISQGKIGEVFTVSANLGYKINTVERVIQPELAGGALLDLTVYPLNFASMICGDGIKKITASCVMTDTGVDGQDTVMIEYQDGKMASLFTTIYTRTNRMGLICGSEGYIEVDNINNPQQIKLYSVDKGSLQLPQIIEVPKQITGYEYQVQSCMKAIMEGKTECPEMPHAQTLEIMRQMDEIRNQFGIVYPFE